MEYPIFKLPQYIKEIMDNPINAIQKPIEPIYPVKPSPIEYSQNASTFFGMLIVLSIFMILGTVATGSEEAFGIISITVIILIISIIGVSSSNSNRKSKDEEYKTKLNQYNKELADYEVKSKEFNAATISYNELIESLNTPKKMEKFKFESIKNELLNQSVEIVENINPKKGVTEIFFEKNLRKYFQESILVDCAFSIQEFDSGNYYSPDFIYYDSKTNLKLDIEVDEPYTMDSKKPIHYQFSDDERDKFILSVGAFIIRFTEKQVFENPDGCCKTIAECINSILPNQIDIELFENTTELENFEQPSIFEARKMAEENYREKYLSNN